MWVDFIDRRHLDFLLYEIFDVVALCQHARYTDHDRETFDAILDTAERVARDKFLEHAARLDEHEPTFDGESVHLIPEVKEAIDAYVEAGFAAAPFPTELGGMDLPYTVVQAYMAVFYAANTGSAGYPFLTLAAANLLAEFGSESQKDRFLKPMVEGRFHGTMCLSEPQAGSSLGDITTRADRQPDGTYRIRGSKMWISGGDHNLSENIIHLVLAKVPGGPPGVKGISLFIVPKLHVDANGKSGEKNDVALAGLNHKMGYRGTVNTVLQFGENNACVGHLVGREHEGIRYMFHMMNEARIGVGLGATMLGTAGFLFARNYAKERTQGRSIADKDPKNPPIAIIEHADVRRMLLQQKAYVEGALALCIYCARLIDQIRVDEEADDARQLLDVLTPITKAWPSEYCLEANALAIQVLGGYGYSREYPVERLYRDNRLNAIHEGTNGIQALDLLGRKVLMNNGAALHALVRQIHGTIHAAATTSELAAFAETLQAAVVQMSETTQILVGAALEGKTDLFLANATLYLHALGHTVIGWMWLQQAIAATEALASHPSDTFYLGKMRACQYFFRWEMPRINRWSELLSSLDDTCLATDPATL
jgi:alkylation response protein AidB-like acyl-CoA dehydrogenase